MDDEFSKTGNALQAGGLIEVSQHRSGTILAPESALLRVAHEREDTVMAKQKRQQSARNITATDDQ